MTKYAGCDQDTRSRLLRTPSAIAQAKTKCRPRGVQRAFATTCGNIGPSGILLIHSVSVRVDVPCGSPTSKTVASPNPQPYLAGVCSRELSCVSGRTAAPCPSSYSWSPLCNFRVNLLMVSREYRVLHVSTVVGI